jgi:molybdenum cofactor guanylyltransferase
MGASPRVRPEIGGYVLAGGRSTRMGRDKALLDLAGKPLVQHAVLKLRRLTDDVSILSGRPELAAFAPLVPDLRENRGPLGGIEAALAHTRHDWIFVLPVDMPFLPTFVLEQWSRSVVGRPLARIAFFTIDGLPQAALCMLHREVAPLVALAAEQGRFKLSSAFEAAAATLARQLDVPLPQVLLNEVWDDSAELHIPVVGDSQGQRPWRVLTEAQLAARHLWFANLNTPEEFAEAAKHIGAIDTSTCDALG